MVIESLVKLYGQLADQGKVGHPGWADAKISFALCLDDEGAVTAVTPLKEEAVVGKKTVMKPMKLTVPAPVKRSSNVAPNFLWDNSMYMLCCADKGKPAHTEDCFAGAKKLHRKLLGTLESPAAKAVCRFFDTWDPENLEWMPCYEDCREELMTANITFMYGEDFVFDIPEVRQAWEKHYLSSGSGPEGVCMVTGEKGKIELVHPAVKGIKGAQATGAALVSFNAPSLCSYGKKQGANAPMSQFAAFAYTSALNYLIASREHSIMLGNTTVLFWTDPLEPVYTDLLKEAVTGDGGYTQDELLDFVRKISRGEAVTAGEHFIDPDKEICLLGISPNAARLSVRFFYRDSFRFFAGNIMRHYERMEIVRPGFDTNEFVPAWKVLDETVNQGLKSKEPLPGLAGEFITSILMDRGYPQALMNGILARIRVEKDVPRNKAAVIKAYYLKNPHPQVPKEVLTVALNNSDDIAYRLGRLFAALERIQSQAEGKLNATIKDRYFSGASQHPKNVFPTLMRLAQNHLAKIGKMSEGLRVVLDKDITEICEPIDRFPAFLTQAQQGSFSLGYYHQKQSYYTKKDNNKKKEGE